MLTMRKGYNRIIVTDTNDETDCFHIIGDDAKKISEVIDTIKPEEICNYLLQNVNDDNIIWYPKGY